MNGAPAGDGASRSAALHARAREISPGGVHGAARYYPPFPLYFQRAEGARLWDVDGREYLDLNAAWGTAALGYNDPVVRETVVEVLRHEGVLFGTPHPREVELSEALVERIPCADMVALCGGGGSDPLYFGYRLARSLTGRRRLLKFEGEYHGWHDPLAVSVLPPLERAGPDDDPQPVPVSSGAAEGSTDAVIGILNDTDRLERVFRRHGDELACAVIEPVCHTSGCIPIDAEFLHRLRKLCTRHEVVLMFDEILTGMRHSVRGAQALVGVTPDIAAFGKALGNGYPISALVGQREFMSGLTPLGGALYSGTFCGHLVSVAAAQATIRELERRRVHEHTARLTTRIGAAVNATADEHDIHAVCQSFGSVFCTYFGQRRVRNYRDVAWLPGVAEVNASFRQNLLDAGVFTSPYLFTRCFVSAAHTETDADHVANVITDFLRGHREQINRMARRAVA